MNLTFRSVLEHGIEPAAALLTRGFADYFVNIQITTVGLLNMVRQDSVDLQLSRVILRDDQPAGVALIARRGWSSRLAAMSIVPAERKRGLGRSLVQQLLNEAIERGDRSMTLEVIEQNAAAVQLYEKCGFQIDRRLVGYREQPNVHETNLELQTVDVREVARALVAYGPADLPWQISGETLAQSGPPAVAYRSPSSYIAISDPGAFTINLRAVVTLPEARRQGNATSLLLAAFARHPGKTWRVTPHFPEEIGGLFVKVGLERDLLTQWQMTIPLAKS